MKNNDENEIIGIVYPLRKNNFELLKKRKNPVYIKYTPHSNSKNPTKICEGNFLLFYLAHGSKLIIGYSKIIKVTFKLPFDIKQQYIDRIQMEKNEFDRYISTRKSKSLLFLELERIIEFQNPVKVNYPITMAGRYVTIVDIKNLGFQQIII